MAKIETTLSDAQVRIAEALFALKPVVTVGKRAGNPVSTEIPLATFPEAAWLKIVSYGAQRTFNDAIGGSDTDQADKVKQVRAMIADYAKGIVGRQAAEGVDAVTAGIRNVMKAKLKANLKGDKLAKFEAMEGKELGETLDKAFAAQGEAFQTKVRETVEARIKQRAAEKAALSAINVEFDL